jgi:hypothetical protein
MPNDMGREDVPEKNVRGMRARRYKRRVATREGRRIPRSVGRCNESHPEWVSFFCSGHGGVVRVSRSSSLPGVSSFDAE